MLGTVNTISTTQSQANSQLGIRVELINNDLEVVAVREFPESEREAAMAFPEFWVLSGKGFFLESSFNMH